MGHGQVGGAAGIGILITAASVHKHRDGPGMGTFDFGLSVSGIVAAEFLMTQGGAVTGVTKHDRDRFPGGILRL